MDSLKPTSVLGLTATPFRLTQKGDRYSSWSELEMLSRNNRSYFKEMLKVVQIQEMTSRGYWADLQYECYDFDEGLLQLNTSGAEFTDHSISEAIEEQGVNNNIYKRIKQMLKTGERKNILVFCDCLATCEKMVTLFPGSAMVSGNTPKKERELIIDNFVNGKIQVVFNFGTLTTGFDHPELDCVIMGRPTNSLALWYQIGGRGTRIHDLKENCLIIDYCNNVKRFGRFEDLRFENIEGYGWGLFNGDNRLLTNCPMGAEVFYDEIVNQVQVDETEKEDITMWFGKYKGKKLSEVDFGYMAFMLDKFDFNNPKMKELKRQLEIRIKEKAIKG
jgi:DNA repair protein RadD